MSVKEYISSGILEQYVLGAVTQEEAREVQRMAATHVEVRKEIEEISKALEQHAMDNAVMPSPKIKPFLMATIDYSERMESGETASFPPALTEKSKIIDYAQWLNRKDMYLPADADHLFAKIIGYTPEALTAIVWIKDFAPPEVHTNEHEKFLIVEGTCNIVVDQEVYSLIPGDFFTIPLHKTHKIIVTSQSPCKVILQRSAA